VPLVEVMLSGAWLDLVAAVTVSPVDAVPVDDLRSVSPA
jgi:hypothetical protein